MKLTAEQKELFRSTLLRILAEIYPCSLTISAIAEGVQIAGFRSREDEVLAACSYLKEKGLLEEDTSELSAALERFKASDKGVQYAEANFLI